MCDYNVEWNGWYRMFYNGENAQMPESCVNQYTCGTSEPLTLNGAHPQLEDGVVTRQVCVSSQDGCCSYTSHPIRVKACPGNYYVYEFVKPTVCGAYCVDAPNQSISSTTETIPSIGSITPPITTTAPPVDPCYNYTILDDSWRATNNQHSSQIMCDTWVSWNGWYRLFIQGQSVQMPDTCVDEYSCGTHAPLWLNGGHPTVEDGVVTRDVCGHWSNNCCYFQSNPIKVKACPGDYYVYEFVRPTSCSLAYCADSSNITTTTTTVMPETTTTMDTTTESTTDPCYDYNTLDESWRDIRQSPFQYYEYDDTLVEWGGWYRLYLNGESAQMSEWCVSYVGCGGQTALSLNGSHPTLEDGVVTRGVLGTYSWYWWYSNQCGAYSSSSIRVKACPGDYYVYEFVKPIISSPQPMYCAVAFQSISSDPCYNYESLDRPWRANNESGGEICDDMFSWNGWYRLFYYGMDIRMSETCISTFTCNTYYNLWLSDPHPQIEDGVVIREICGGAYWGSCCDYKFKPIRVKACPGNYYVYELVNQAWWCSGYCTDVSTISQAVSTVSPDKFTGSTINLNYDPCNNYNTLDNYWRSTLNYWSSYGYIIDNDDTRVEWDGWYRLFIDGSSAQMPEWCFNYMTCGGFSSLYLGDSHPRLEDGVVTREVYGSHYEQCSHYRSDPIQVKACPGNYYVYKFIRPTLSIPVPVYCAVSFSTPSVDPCYNYTSLDEPWRSTDNSSFNFDGMCDYNVEWNGWYRMFYNGENAQMPESCVNQYTCGTYDPLTLNGAHPQLEDGVVTRQVCVSSWGVCCTYTSHPIRVKACPGNYYVYEFVKPMFCGAYCVDASNQSISSTTETIPSIGSITPPITTTAFPVDPCYYYNILDDSWRATNNQHSSQIMCDTAVSWNGWYRLFIQGQSVQMPDTCVDEYSCGTNAPLWLNGGHPTVEDGVVTRDVCGHWSNNCCYFQSNPIKVKACPGDFYVYEFVSPTTCHLAYCADSSNITTTTTTVMPETTTTETTTTETTTMDTTTEPTTDPCYDYITLDESWRDIRQSSNQNYGFDDTLVEWSGWYRLYLNGESAQMSEWCVSNVGCGGQTALSLNGSHPTLEDGVVTREVLGSNAWYWWYSNQCGAYNSSSIRVKACPGDYYVYEFVKPVISSPQPMYCAVAFQNISSDPCYNYESLDRPWRANNEIGDTVCDEGFSWNGWYRLFYYGMDIRMYETCISSYSCNTYFNLRLNDPHPQIEDGVVIREICGGSYWGSCCEYKTTPIRVKACPGNYYVYELVNPQIWCSGYCTDVSTISQAVSTVSPDIFTGSTITLNYDPCNNYNTLDNYWRSTLNYWFMYGLIIDHDDTRVEWDGWYRLFINGSSAQMPEWCMSYLSCGGFSSLYLGDSHPRLEDGVVTREVYGTHYDQCSRYRSDPIQVKACPGNYYVYKFTRPPLSIPAPVYCAVPFSTPSVDPCYNYTSLDEPWRSTDNYYYNNYYNYGMCDFNVEWNGWYRMFNNGENTQMPESCVNPYMCGTYDPLTLNGAHPQLEDGVVTRQVCVSSWDDCCTYTSHPIRVKACPGNYYVYEFVKPIFCGAYCVDSSNQSISSTTETIPSIGSITPPITTTAPPVDPCYNYTILDDSWRATNNQHSSQIMCDAWVSWNGWYRLFIQGQSVQMPDTCVEEYSCGTHAPLWLNGGHPTVEDGVVTRDVCGHWSNNCCYFQSNPIKVKACPGDYYVYEFVSPTTCHLAYCADSSTINTTTTVMPETTTTETTTTETTTMDNTTEPTTDPCYDYNTLDESWRDIRQSPFQYYEYDDTLVEWSGWYRLYLNGESAQMSEWCVSYVGCGGQTALYISGSHPTLEDGVVTRDVVGTNAFWYWGEYYSYCGVYSSSSIRVKACPGDYYVYEFVKPIISSPQPMYCAVTFQSISSDPCYNYESLDRPWRANNESGDSICDEGFSWNGWYRFFYYGMDIRMYETCISTFACNTKFNLRLSGPHPQIEDGVVIREVCAGYYWGSCCDYLTTPIRVKACPGNYYVYELVNPQIWCSGYCTDVSTISKAVSTVSPDIFTGSTINLNYDPCNNYNTLDNYWRSTLNYGYIYGHIIDHDDTRVEWDGWYRLFIDGSSAQMPEWCFYYMSCGGYSSLYLGDSHPRLEDGVVTREVYGSRYEQCSRYRSDPIQVKACPGNYYVYKFTRPTLSIPAPVYCAVPFSTPSVDPCYNYTSLDEPWRSTDNYYYNNYYNYGMCDYNVEWNGWYRMFNNGENAQMPESCVNQYMCGTDNPLSLNGAHPQLEDGVVTRQVCVSSWSGCCSYTSHPIRVKACPGNYYVYEFVKPMVCGAYCVDAPNQSILPTSETIPSIGSITPPITTTAPPVDPCYNYTILDDSWRATNNQHSSQIMCDTAVSWNGWYRLFIQGQSVQMPDTCVDEYSCGTHAPLWLNGGHPTVEDGVVTRDVCGHWSNNCCYFQSNPIKVKACPGDYYVYEFVRPTACHLSYCADSSNINTTTTVMPETTTTETTTTETTTMDNTTEPTTDPCYDYIIVDESWRDIRQSPFQNYGFDDTLVEWSGWYRLYLNGESAQMSEWGVSFVGCGGQTALSLSGSHPTLEDGVVTRGVVGNYWCYWGESYNYCGSYSSSSILVKACPGDYYVYEFVKPVISAPQPMYCAVAFQSISSDPCYNYESLDRPWRANNESGNYICDEGFSWNGWYRLFYNGMDIRMYETCFSSYSCNTYINLRLFSPHPQIEDGVVIRVICGSSYWGSCCDYMTTPIRVKACPGNYYVYELVNPKLGCTGYCTDVNTISQAVSTVSPDIFTGSTINLNYDPCNNYNTLDNYWRSTLNYWSTYGYIFDNDDTRVEWDGWYRLFIDGSSAQMPEWCYKYMSCGGFSSLWLDGSHPRLEDGVVTREVYGSSNDQCGRYRSDPIQVKACPGNYYVYKFTRPTLSIPVPVYCAVSFSTPSVDPCYNYTSLDEPWRSTDNYNYYRMCDYNVEWNGWYRMFNNGENAQMPESCVNQYTCGTDNPLTLNGAHPQLEDGVVTRQVCISSWGDCCTYTSHPIRVKACPGNYYVYEFVKPMICGAYCVETIPSIGSITPPITTTDVRDRCSELSCSEDEWCGKKNGVYGCLCNEDHHRPQPDSFDFSETCESSSGSISVSRCQLFEAGFPADVLHLNDPDCKGTVRNGRVEFLFDNDEHICGTNLVANGTHFIYNNFIVGTPRSEGLIISRQKILHLNFSCAYPQSQTLSMNVEINPLGSMVNKTLPAGEGRYQVRMIPYEDDEFTRPFTGRVNAELDQEMHVEVRVEGVDSRQFALVMDTCWATPVNDPDYSLRWDLILSECPNPDDDTVDLLQNGVSTSSRFSFRMFIFTANSTKLYLHCAVHLCLLSSNRCSTNCSSGHQRRERRSLDFHDSASISMGPLVWSERSSDIPIPDKVQGSGAPGLCGSLFLLMVSLLSAYTLLYV
ncbi:uncharacterized protein LOC120474774 isoform X2 [Pimephales promelas]|uniref:uncharacterized protein LOC120474774 isoform X2 n=1 Tax=Pimephales promelas TaxID=90988 RepID=UPI001955D267|nr:uncharacterized protein LOC120474774 isoform X2 [Pimephales promelas]